MTLDDKFYPNDKGKPLTWIDNRLIKAASYIAKPITKYTGATTQQIVTNAPRVGGVIAALDFVYLPLTNNYDPIDLMSVGLSVAGCFLTSYIFKMGSSLDEELTTQDRGIMNKITRLAVSGAASYNLFKSGVEMYLSQSNQEFYQSSADLVMFLGLSTVGFAWYLSRSKPQDPPKKKLKEQLSETLQKTIGKERDQASDPNPIPLKYRVLELAYSTGLF